MDLGKKIACLKFLKFEVILLWIVSWKFTVSVKKNIRIVIFALVP